MTPDDARIQIAVEGEGNRVVAAYEGQTVRLEVFSERGMGRAAAEIPPAAWPAALTFRLHLGGLELFRFQFAPYTVEVSVSSAAGHEVIETVSQDAFGTDTEITPDSPFWMAVTRTPHPDDPRALYFDVDAPAALLNGIPRPFAFQWLDFYR